MRTSVRCGLVGWSLALLTASAGSPAIAESSVLFVDGFESGSLASWTTVTSLTTQQQDVATGSWAARATSSGAAASFARKRLASAENDVVLSAAAKVVTQGRNTVTLMTLRTSSGASLAGVHVTAAGRLALRNFVTSTTEVSPTVVDKGVWHRVSLSARIAGGASELEVMLDGSSVPSLGGTVPLGTTGVGQVQIGDAASGRSFTVGFDDVTVSRRSTDDTAPSAPSGLVAEAASARQVNLSWTAATDDVGVTGYHVYRDGVAVATVGAQTDYSDLTVSEDTTYDYTVRATDRSGNASVASRPASVTTPGGPEPSDPVIAAAGDIACAPGTPVTATTCHQQGTANLLNGAQKVLALGDNQYGAGLLSEYRGSYDPTWGRYKAVTAPVAGNHEYRSGSPAGYFDYFGPAAGTRGQGWYSYDVGAWHLIALNSIEPMAQGSPQNRWLESDLAAHPTRCVLAYWHYPLYAAGSIAPGMGKSRPAWSDLLGARADVVLAGHEHQYERWARMNQSGAVTSDGIRQFVVGTGGVGHSSSPVTQRAGLEKVDSTAFGVLRLTLHPDSYDWTLVSENGSVRDAGSDACVR